MPSRGVTSVLSTIPSMPNRQLSSPGWNGHAPATTSTAGTSTSSAAMGYAAASTGRAFTLSCIALSSMSMG
jgi:hypothetical protein